MMYAVEYTRLAKKTLAKWKKSNHRLFKKAVELLDDIMAHPRIGLGHPEPLKKGMDNTYSRHITAKDRIIYDIVDERILVTIVQLEEHYDDK